MGVRAVILAIAMAGCAHATEQGAEGVLSGLDPAAVQAQAPQTNAIVVMRAGAVVGERYFNGARAGDLVNTRSATKTITAMLAGIAIADGDMSLTGSVWPYLPEAQGEPREAVTIEDLLTMSSSLACDDSSLESPGNEENMYPQREWARWASALPADPNYARDEEGRGPFRYCTAGVVLLGSAIARAANAPLEDFAMRRLFAPLGIHDARWFHSPSGEPMPGGGLELSARDLARLGWLLADGGRWSGAQILPPDFVQRMLTTHRRPNAEQRYGYLIWGRTFRTRCGDFEGWHMAGNGGNVVLILPSAQLVIVVARTAYNTRGMHQQTTELLEQTILPSMVCGR